VARAAVPGRLSWHVATVKETRDETATARTLLIDVPGWPGHMPGQHVAVKLTAADGYSAQRDYSIAGAPEDGRVELTVQRLDDGEVSSYLAGVAEPGDQFEVRGPIGGWFAWRAADPRPLLLLAGGSGIVPLMSMIRTHAQASSQAPVRLIYSARTPADVIYATELAERERGSAPTPADVAPTPGHTERERTPADESRAPGQAGRERPTARTPAEETRAPDQAGREGAALTVTYLYTRAAPQGAAHAGDSPRGPRRPGGLFARHREPPGAERVPRLTPPGGTQQANLVVPRVYAGRLNAAVIAATAFPPEANPAIFACGPSGFVEAASRLLVAAGHTPGAIKTERFGPT
jgi:ferredoxin-NADP reductase